VKGDTPLIIDVERNEREATTGGGPFR
jgi:hypothetical protein